MPAPGTCADCYDELGLDVHVCDSDKCRAEHVIMFHERIRSEDLVPIKGEPLEH